MSNVAAKNAVHAKNAVCASGSARGSAREECAKNAVCDVRVRRASKTNHVLYRLEHPLGLAPRGAGCLAVHHKRPPVVGARVALRAAPATGADALAAAAVKVKLHAAPVVDDAPTRLVLAKVPAGARFGAQAAAGGSAETTRRTPHHAAAAGSSAAAARAPQKFKSSRGLVEDGEERRVSLHEAQVVGLNPRVAVADVAREHAVEVHPADSAGLEHVSGAPARSCSLFSSPCAEESVSGGPFAHLMLAQACAAVFLLHEGLVHAEGLRNTNS